MRTFPCSLCTYFILRRPQPAGDATDGTGLSSISIRWIHYKLNPAMNELYKCILQNSYNYSIYIFFVVRTILIV